MKIKNKKTGFEYTVTETEWQAMQGRGDARKFTVLSKAKPKPRSAKNNADYEGILADATAAFKAKDYVKAKSLYEKALAIRPTDFITEKLAELAEIASSDDLTT